MGSDFSLKHRDEVLEQTGRSVQWLISIRSLRSGGGWRACELIGSESGRH